MFQYYITYYGYQILKKITNYAKYSGLLNYTTDFNISKIDKHVSVSNLPRQYYRDIIKHFDVVIGFLGKDEYGYNECQWLYHEPTIKYYNIPVVDYTPPQLEDYKKLFHILTKHKHQKILIHCYAGKGRSNCGVAAYLMLINGYTAEDAIKEVRSKNPISNMNLYQLNSLKHLEQNKHELFNL